MQAKFFDDFQFDNVLPQGQKLSKEFRQSNLTRSQTDSNITYISEEVPEAPGSLNYITKDGDVDFEVVLRVCSYILLSFLNVYTIYDFFRPFIFQYIRQTHVKHSEYAKLLLIYWNYCWTWEY